MKGSNITTLIVGFLLALTIIVNGQHVAVDTSASFQLDKNGVTDSESSTLIGAAVQETSVDDSQIPIASQRLQRRQKGARPNESKKAGSSQSKDCNSMFGAQKLICLNSKPWKPKLATTYKPEKPWKPSFPTYKPSKPWKPNLPTHKPNKPQTPSPKPSKDCSQLSGVRKILCERPFETGTPPKLKKDCSKLSPGSIQRMICQMSQHPFPKPTSHPKPVKPQNPADCSKLPPGSVQRVMCEMSFQHPLPKPTSHPKPFKPQNPADCSKLPPMQRVMCQISFQQSLPKPTTKPKPFKPQDPTDCSKLPFMMRRFCEARKNPTTVKPSTLIFQMPQDCNLIPEGSRERKSCEVHQNIIRPWPRPGQPTKPTGQPSTPVLHMPKDCTTLPKGSQERKSCEFWRDVVRPLPRPGQPTKPTGQPSTPVFHMPKDCTTLPEGRIERKSCELWHDLVKPLPRPGQPTNPKPPKLPKDCGSLLDGPEKVICLTTNSLQHPPPFLKPVKPSLPEPSAPKPKAVGLLAEFPIEESEPIEEVVKPIEE